jgi:long-chain acyl-CoA synthetase
MVTAAVELRPQMSVDAVELQTFARQHIAAFKCPKVVCIVERLPRTASGKVQRAEVRRRLQAERAGA